MRTDSSPLTIFRKDYTPPAYLVDTVELGFDLDPDRTVVANRVTLRRNPAAAEHGAGAGAGAEIVLHGEQIELVALRMNGALLKPSQYKLGASTLTSRK